MSAVVVDTQTPTLREGAFGHARALSCRECGHEVELGPHYACPECFGPLEIAYDFPAITREQIEAGPNNIWRYKALLPVPDDIEQSPNMEPGYTRLLKANNLGRDAGDRQPLGQGRQHQPHQLLQGPGRGLRAERGDRVPVEGLRLPVDRQPRQRRRCRRRSGRNQDGGVHPERSGDAQAGQLSDLHRLTGRRERQL